MAEGLGKTEVLAMPVMIDEGSVCKDCVFVSLQSQVQEQVLSEASKYRVVVWDPLKRARLAGEISKKLVGLIGQTSSCAPELLLEQPAVVAAASSHDRAFAMLGGLINVLAQRAGTEGLDCTSDHFAHAVSTNAGRVFGHLRLEADRAGDRDVLKQLTTKAECANLLRMFCESVAPAQVVEGVCGSTAHVQVQTVKAEDFLPLRVLTWNLDATGLPANAPVSFNVRDKAAAVEAEICRLEPDIIALQECADAQPLARLSQGYVFAGAAQAHAGYVHLYVGKGLGMERQSVDSGCPCVGARVHTTSGVQVAVRALHLPWGEARAEERLRTLTRIRRGVTGSVVVLGDFNVRPDEVDSISTGCSLTEAEYAGLSWNPRKSRYYASGPLQQHKGPGYAFDRIFYDGSVCARAFLVCEGRVYSEGCSFSLSDHYGVLAALDAHASHGGGAAAGVVRANRRVALCRYRDQLCLQERRLAAEMARAGRQEAPKQAALAQAALTTRMLAQARSMAEARQQRRRQLWSEAFGPDSVFAGSAKCDVSPFQCLVDVEVPGLDGLSAVPSRIAWQSQWHGKSLLKGLRLDLCVATALQIFLSAPPAAQWLAWHNEHCVEAEGCMHCALCGLALGGVPPDPQHNLHNTLDVAIGARGFDCVGQAMAHVLDTLSLVERRADRVSDWQLPLVADGRQQVTHVERMCGLVIEERRRCADCHEISSRSVLSQVLWLPAVTADVDDMSINDLYLLYCAPQQELDWHCPADRCSHVLRQCVLQRRLATTPQMLFMALPRAVPGVRVRIDEVISLVPGASMDLQGASYVFDAARHAVATRSPQGSYWWFGQAALGHPLSVEVANVGQRNVEFLMYVAARGADAFAGGEATATGPVLPVRVPVACAAQSEAPAPMTCVRAGGGPACDSSTSARGSHGVPVSHAEGQGQTGSTCDGVEDETVAPPWQLHGVPAARMAAWRLISDMFARIDRMYGSCLGGLVKNVLHKSKLGEGHANDLVKSSWSMRWHGWYEAASRINIWSGRLSGTLIDDAPAIIARVLDDFLQEACASGQLVLDGTGTNLHSLQECVRRRFHEKVAGEDKFYLLRPGRATDLHAIGSRTPLTAVGGSGVDSKSWAGVKQHGAAPRRPRVQLSGPDSRKRALQVRGAPARSDIAAASGASGARDAEAAAHVRIRSGLLAARLELVLPAAVMELLVQGLVRYFDPQQACILASQRWFADLVAFRGLANDFLDTCGPDTAPAVAVERMTPRVTGALAEVARVVAAQRGPLIIRKTDALRRQELLKDGWVFHSASGDGSNCLADSLLQLLVLHGLLQPVPPEERLIGCGAFRSHLLEHPRLQPRDADDRLDPLAYLQHHRHAEAAVYFFLDRFSTARDQVRLPDSGLQLVVHSRMDAKLPEDRTVICRGSGVAGDVLQLTMFNTTGDGFQGRHYDALFRPRTEDQDLFDGSAPSNACLARMRQKQGLPMFVQCPHGRTSGDFCRFHTTVGKRAFGLWDPPSHGSLPDKKRQEALQELPRRRGQPQHVGTSSASSSRGAAAGFTHVEQPSDVARGLLAMQAHVGSLAPEPPREGPAGEPIDIERPDVAKRRRRS